MENDILKHRKAVQENILKSFGAEVSEDMLEKAHNHGDVHSNGKWYWESSANGGKGDWRTIKGTVKTAANSKTDTDKKTDKDDKKNSNDFTDKKDSDKKSDDADVKAIEHKFDLEDDPYVKRKKGKKQGRDRERMS